MAKNKNNIKNINIVSNNYSRYGISIYEKLYDKPIGSYSNYNNGSNNNNNNNKHNKDDCNNIKLTSSGSFTSMSSIKLKNSSNKLNKITSYDDSESIITNSSKTSKIKRKYKSLIATSSKKLINKLYDHGSNDSFSIFSTKSHNNYLANNNPPYKNTTNQNNSIKHLNIDDLHYTFDENFADINNLPVEILQNILSFIDLEENYSSLICCLYLSKKFYKATKLIIYNNPHLTSTYRVAQFVTSIRLHPENGLLVKNLDLSNLKNGLILQEIDNNTNTSTITNNSLAHFRTHSTSRILNNNNNNNTQIGDDERDPNLTETDTNNNNNTSDIQLEPLHDIAYAGWRDWRYRNDPLYSSPVLNSYNLKRVVSHSSSIYSNSSDLTVNSVANSASTNNNNQSLFNSNNNMSNTSINNTLTLTHNSNNNNNNSNTNTNTNSNNNRRIRSNSSVSSITSSIMSSFQNTSHISLNSTYTSNNSPQSFNNKNTHSPTLFNGSMFNNNNNNNNNFTYNGNNINNNTANNNFSNNNDEIKWFRFNLGYKNKRRIRNIKNSTQLDIDSKTNNSCGSTSSLATINNINNGKYEILMPRNGKNNNNSNEQLNTNVPRSIRFAMNQPFKTNHPYTNKFLLKYAQYRDLPLGYILHLLKCCPNLINLNLSNLIICSDFEIINKPKHHKRLRSLILPSVEESTVMTNSDDNRLPEIYVTDSCKNYENIIQNYNNNNTLSNSISSTNNSSIHTNNSSNSNNDNNNTSESKGFNINNGSSNRSRPNSVNFENGMNPNYWIKSGNNWNDYPLPIDFQTKLREEKRRNSSNRLNDNVQLRKLNPSEIFDMIIRNNCDESNNENGCVQNYLNLSSIKMDGVVWCRQLMIKNFIFNTFVNSESNEENFMNLNKRVMNLSFLKSGMNRHFVWACKGSFYDFMVLIVLDELLKLDDNKIEDTFNIKSERILEADIHKRDADIIEISEIFGINYGKQREDEDEQLKFRLTILKSDRPTSFNLTKVTNTHISLVIRLCVNENYNFEVPRGGSLPKDSDKRIDRLTHGLMAKIRLLRNNDLRRNVGQNSYINDQEPSIIA